MTTPTGLALAHRIGSQRSLYYLCKNVLDYKDAVDHVHREVCFFQTSPIFGRFRQVTIPRSWFKTWICTIAKAIWLTLPDEEGLYKDIYPYKGPNMRVLIASNVIDNAAKMVNKIKMEWMNNEKLKAAFPEIVPDFNKTRWSDHCAEVRRDLKATEGTYTAVGVGGSVISQHFDHILEDDLVYAKKDDFTGQELMPSQEDIENAIGWHKLSFSLLSNPKTGCIDNTGTRWAPHDLIDYIKEYETHYQRMEICATKDGMWPIPDDSYCIWPERYDKEALEQIRATQGAKIFETQYLNRPRAGEDVTFDISFLNLHDNISEFPKGLKWRTIVDLAGWSDTKRRVDRNVILTGAKDEKGHLWVARVDYGRYNPSEVIALFKAHRKQFNSKVMVEAVQYQKAIAHFAKLDMEHDGDYYQVESIPYDGKKNAKDLRIQALEPNVLNGTVHVMRNMKALIQEMEDYPYGSTKDILDCLGYLRALAPSSKTEEIPPELVPFSIDAIEKELHEKANSTTDLPFDVQLGRPVV